MLISKKSLTFPAYIVWPLLWIVILFLLESHIQKNLYASYGEHNYSFTELVNSVQYSDSFVFLSSFTAVVFTVAGFILFYILARLTAVQRFLNKILFVAFIISVLVFRFFYEQNCHEEGCYLETVVLHASEVIWLITAGLMPLIIQSILKVPDGQMTNVFKSVYYYLFGLLVLLLLAGTWLFGTAEYAGKLDEETSYMSSQLEEYHAAYSVYKPTNLPNLVGDIRSEVGSVYSENTLENIKDYYGDNYCQRWQPVASYSLAYYLRSSRVNYLSIDQEARRPDIGDELFADEDSLILKNCTKVPVIEKLTVGGYPSIYYESNLGEPTLLIYRENTRIEITSRVAEGYEHLNKDELLHIGKSLTKVN